ncbi:NAD(P)/FAD-dependent oxidoreductase [Dietzia aerolata]|uniref:NAD(P)/FAD-dependent oxidoreductase n=2 Tax=Dietzia aerolata TaxID=595984 RepID=A0ABV5JWG7_9ACTN
MSGDEDGRQVAPVVIVGAGLAGAKSAEALRHEGWRADIILVGAERHLPYERPPLSKGFLGGEQSVEDFTVHDRAWYEENRIDLRLGVTVTVIDPAGREVRLSEGHPLAYSVLVLATGSGSARPSIPGADGSGVLTLRDLDQAETLCGVLREGARLGVVGGGWIGLEVAASARGRGAEVIVVEAAGQPLAAALGPELGAVFADVHRAHGVDLRLGTAVEEIVRGADGTVTGLRLSDGDDVPVDVVLLAVGARPETTLAEAAGLEMADRGVAVDAQLRASAPGVYAVGDIAAVLHPFYGERVRTEHWAAALNQPGTAARAINGLDASYDRLPYFFTDQYDVRMEFTGRTDGYTDVVYRGDVGSREFIAFWLDAERRVLAGMNVNVWDVVEDIRSLIVSRQPVDPEALADPDTDLGGLAG